MAALRGRCVSADRSSSSGKDGTSMSQGTGVDDGIEKTRLLTHKADVLRVNEEVTSYLYVLRSNALGDSITARF